MIVVSLVDGLRKNLSVWGTFIRQPQVCFQLSACEVASSGEPDFMHLSLCS